jgi:hypothetical protein
LPLCYLGPLPSLSSLRFDRVHRQAYDLVSYRIWIDCRFVHTKALLFPCRRTSYLCGTSLSVRLPHEPDLHFHPSSKPLSRIHANFLQANATHM